MLSRMGELAKQPGRDDVVVPGAVFTLEPGLYYASKGDGVRLEDVYACTPEGDFECLTPFPKELVIPIEHRPADLVSEPLIL